MEKPTRRSARPSPVRVAGDSMSPTLPAGALVAVFPVRGAPHLGAVVVVRRPDGTEHLKRVAATPGDRFERPGGDGFVLGPDEFAVVGDNLGASTDSRHYGAVRRGDIVAIARACYWPPRCWKLLRVTPRPRRAGRGTRARGRARGR